MSGQAGAKTVFRTKGCKVRPPIASEVMPHKVGKVRPRMARKVRSPNVCEGMPYIACKVMPHKGWAKLRGAWHPKLDRTVGAKAGRPLCAKGCRQRG
jgi:hypothetical protein